MPLKKLGILALAILGTCTAHTFEMNNLRFSNRAQCAVDSEKPTDTVFLIVDGYNAGKLGNSLGRLNGQEPTEVANESMRQFRIATAKLTQLVIDKLTYGHLPLLPVDTSAKTSLVRYQKLAANCDGKVYCEDLEQYVAELWAQSSLPASARRWNQIDGINSSHFTSSAWIRGSSCAYIKRFSALQGHLHGTEPTKPSLEELARNYMNRAEFMTGCADTAAELDNRNAILQIDLKAANNEELFNQKGFHFWNSARIYLSWAWRNAAELEEMAGAFASPFRSLAFEESIMLVPNGCRSLTPPACDSETLSLNSLREFAKLDNTAPQTQIVPDGPEADLLSRGPRAVNNDFLGTRSFMTANEWVGNLRKRMVQTRGQNKTRFMTALQTMNIVQDSFSANELAALTLPLMKQSQVDDRLRNELYYLCTEVRLAGDRRLDFMKSDIDNLGQLENLSRAEQAQGRSIQAHVDYFTQLSNSLVNYCDQLEKSHFWEAPGYTVDKSGFNDWAKEILSVQTDPALQVNPPLIFNNNPLLVWQKNAGASAGNIICSSAIDCARNVTKAMVDLYAVSNYADAFLPVSSKALSPNIFNPYAELKACKIYDPWFQANRVRKRFLADLSNVALFGWNLLPIYLDLDFKPGQVKSFKQMVQDGAIKFDPQLDPEKTQMALLADFGPLVGAPCAVHISPKSAKTFDFYALEGISVNYCKAENKGEGKVERPNEIHYGERDQNAYCGGCSMSFVGVSSAASAATIANGINPFKAAIYTIRAIARYISGNKDKVNIPRSYDVNPAYVVETYKKNNGSIPKDCVDMLSMGYRCFADVCSAKAADYFEKAYDVKVTSVTHAAVRDHYNKSVAKEFVFKTNKCKGEIRVRGNCSTTGKNPPTVYFKMFDGTASSTSSDCRKVINK